MNNSIRAGQLPGIVLLGGLLAFLALWPGVAGAQVGTPTYPDIRSMPPTHLVLAEQTVNDEVHHVMHFMPRIYNRGPGALEVQRVPQTSALADLNQRIYESPAGYRDQRLAAVAISSPFAFDLPNLQRYEVWTERAFKRAAARDFRRGTPLYFTEDVGHCVADVEQVDLTAVPSLPIYSCTAAVMGISPGWADVESPIDPHTVDFGTAPLPDGKYVLRATVDPDNLVWESEGKADPAKEGRVANQGLTNFEIANGALAWQDP